MVDSGDVAAKQFVGGDVVAIYFERVLPSFADRNGSGDFAMACS